MSKRIKALWKREKRKAAWILAVCCLIAAFAEMPIRNVHAAETDAGEPGVSEVTEQSDIKEPIGEPGVSEVTEESDVMEATEKPDVMEATEKPDVLEPDVEPDTPDISGIPEATEKPDHMGESEETEAAEPEETEAAEPEGKRFSFFKEGAASQDRTDDAVELGVELDGMTITDVDGKPLSYKTTTSGDKTIHDVSEYSYYDIGAVKFKVMFDILVDYADGRNIAAGDYFVYRIPTGFSISDGFSSGKLTFNGVDIGSYEKGTDASGNEIMTITFAQGVNASESYNDISGGVELELNFDSAALEGGADKLLQFLPKRGNQNSIWLKLPEEPSFANGITKTGVYDSTDNTIIWTIIAGTAAESKGMLLDGLIIEDVTGAGQAYIDGSAQIVDTDGNAVAGSSVTVSTDGAGKTSITLGTGVKAPCNIQLKTAISKEKIEAAANEGKPTSEIFSNTAVMLAPADGSFTVGQEKTATADVTADFGPKLTKEGVQVDSNTMRWTITVNGTEPHVNVYHGIVTDRLMEGLLYKDGSLTYKVNNGAVNTPGTSDGTTAPWQANALYVETDGSGQQILKFYMAETTNAKYVITFDTTITSAFTGDTNASGGLVAINDATVTADFPYWGPGPGYYEWDYGIPGIECAVSSSMLEKQVSADPKTGILTWTIYPSTRTPDYDNAVITDTIQPDQTYVAGSLHVSKKNADPVGAGITENDSDPVNLKITIPKSAGTLGDYVITYQTKAVNFFSENGKLHTYENEAVLNIIKGSVSKEEVSDTARAAMKNDYLKKSTTVEYIDNVPYFHYKIEVNGNDLSLTNVIVKDDLSDCVFTGKDGNGNSATIPSDNWEFAVDKCRIEKKDGTTDLGKSVTVSGTVAAANLGAITEKYTVHLYATLKSNAKALLTKNVAEPDSLADKMIYSKNKVGAVSDEVVIPDGGGYPVVSDSEKNNIFIDNTLTAKKVSEFNQEKATITWQVVLNPNGGPLSGVVVNDKIPKAVKYITDTVKLYKGVYMADGTVTTGDEVALADSAVAFQVDREYRYMSVNLETAVSGAPYVLKYQTAVVDNKQPSITNEAGMTSAEGSYQSANGVMKLSGSNWATLSTAGKLEITKYDASVGTSMPLAGAEFMIYNDAACTDPVDVGETDGTGKLTIYGLEAGTGSSGTRYYCKETKVPSSAYQENNEVYEVLIKRGEATKITVLNKRKEAASAAQAQVIKKFTCEDASGVKQPVNNLQSEFTLFFYPYGRDTVTGNVNQKDARQVSFTMNSAGIYSYSANGTVKNITNSIADGTLTFTGLPWGVYGLKETAAPDGFAAYKDTKYFQIGYDEVAGSFSVEYYFTGNPAENTITNANTSFFVKKLLEGTVAYLSGVKLQICKKNADGTLTVMTDPLTQKAYEWTTSSSEASTGHKVSNLPKGDYVLHEVPEGTDLTLSLAEDISFSLDLYGNLKQAGVTVTELTMYDMKNTLTIRKEDQFHEDVDGAELTLSGPNAMSIDGYAKTVTTAGGQAVFTELIRGGTYTLSETKTPEGYKTAPDVRIRIGENGTVYVINPSGSQEKLTGDFVMVDRKLFVGLKLQKTDGFSGETLSGAVFSLYRKAEITGTPDTLLLSGIGMTVHNAGTKEAWIGWDIADTPASTEDPATNKPLSRGLGPGSYYLTETKAPDGYKAAPDTEFVITADGLLELISTEHAGILADSGERILIQDEPLTLRIEKYDADTKTALTGAEYEVTGFFAGESVEQTYMLGTNALEQNNILAGKLLAGNIYKVNETKAPLGYQSASDSYVTVAADGTVTVTDAFGAALERTDVKAVNPADEKAGTDGAVQIYDEKIRVDFVKCTSEDGTRISGAEFTIKGRFADGTTEKKINPSADAAAELVGQLIEGSIYTLTEIAPAGYLSLQGEAAFTYTTEDGLKLESGKDGNGHVSVAHASADGSGYANETLIITNDSAQNTTLQFIKYDKEDGSGISGTVFELTYVPENGGGAVTTTYTIPEAGTSYEYETAGQKHRKVTAAGEAFLTDLERGSYTLTEIAPAYAYELGADPFSCTFTVDDEAKNRTIVINRTNADNGAFDLKITGGDALLAGKGIVNERQPGSVTIVKVDALDHTKLLNGVGFTIYRYRDSENIIDWFKQLFTGNAYEVTDADWTEHTEADGTLNIQELPWGRYYIVETAPLEQYVPDETKYEFTIGRNKLTQVLDWTPGKAIINAQAQMTIAQTTTGGVFTLGSRMRLYGKFANYAGRYLEWTIDEKPYVVAGELLEGEEYTLEEAAPYGGHASAAKLRFRYYNGSIQMMEGGENVEYSVALDGTVHLLQKVPPIRVSIKKLDEQKQPVTGAKLSISEICADGTKQPVKTWTSSAEAMLFEGVLSAGQDYLLEELEVPLGYERADDITFHVEDTAEWQYIVMTDKKEIISAEVPSGKESFDTDGGTGTGYAQTKGDIQILPKTGREAVAGFYTAGILLILTGIFLCRTKKKKRT